MKLPRFATDKRLSYKAKGLLALCLTATTRVTRDWIMARSCDGRWTMQSALRELEQYHYAWRSIRRSELGKLNGDQWMFSDFPRKTIPPASRKTHRRETCPPVTGEQENPSPGNLSAGDSKVIELHPLATFGKKSLHNKT